MEALRYAGTLLEGRMLNGSSTASAVAKHIKHGMSFILVMKWILNRHGGVRLLSMSIKASKMMRSGEMMRWDGLSRPTLSTAVE